MIGYVLRRLANYIVLLFVAVSLTYVLAATQLNPRSLFLMRNPPLDPRSIESMLLSRNLSENVPLWERYWTWLTNVLTKWDWGQSPMGAVVNDEIGARIWVSLRLLLIGTMLGLVLGVAIGAWAATRQYKISDRVITVLTHSIMFQYLSQPDRSELLDLLERAGARATAATPLVWLRMEPGGEQAEVRTTSWPGGRTRLVARSSYHGPPVASLL